MTVTSQDVNYMVTVDEDAIEDAVHRVRSEVLASNSKCPECGSRAKISVETEARETAPLKRNVILETECTATEAACTWEYRLLTGAALTLEAKDTRGGGA